jgi:acetyl esterase/lipase
MDLDGSTAVAEAQKMWRFDNACEGRSIDELPADLPIFIVRAGKDQMPRLNEALDRFVAGSLAKNLPLSLVNYARGEHGFDLTNDSEGSREIIRNTLAFLRQWLA